MSQTYKKFSITYEKSRQLPALFILTILFSSCANLSWKNEEDRVVILNLSDYSKKEYIDHQYHLEKSLLATNSNQLINLLPSHKRYLSSLFYKIRKNNELFFKKKFKPEFFVFSYDEPFHFSLPGNKFFLSSSLLEKYIKNESLLNCVLVYEMIRSEKEMYNKLVLFPTGDLSIERMLSLQKISTQNKIKIHQWGYYILRRIDIQGDSYLSWLQIKNRNSLDFIKQLGDVQSISREESLFKSFLISDKVSQGRKIEYRGSSRNFYRLLNHIKAAI